MAKIKAMNSSKPGRPKAKKTTPLKVKKTITLKAKDATSPKSKKPVILKKPKDATSPKPKKSTAAKFLALEKTDDAEFRKKTVQKRQALKTVEGEDRRGVIALTNIPHGFFEGQMHRYFRQFGVLENVRLVRSKKTGQSCGFAYVEFQHYEVAKIVAKHMDGYLTFGKIMKCKVVPPSVVGKKLFKGKKIRPENCPKLNMRKGAIRKLNKQRTEKQIERRTARLKCGYSKKIKKLQELGIELPLQTLLGTQQQQQQQSDDAVSEGAVEGEEAVSEEAVEAPAVNGHTLPEDKDEAMVVPPDAIDIEPSQDINPDLTQEQKKDFGAVREELAAQEFRSRGLVTSSLSAGVSLPARPRPLGDLFESCRESDAIMSQLQSVQKVKTPKKSGGKRKLAAVEETMVLEVDESDDEVVLKTPPNAIKKFVKMEAKSTPTTTPKGKNKTPKSAKGTPKAVKGTPKSAKGTPKSAKKIPKSAKCTPIALEMTSEETPEIVNATPKTPKAGKATPKSAKKTPKALKLQSEEAEETPTSAEAPEAVTTTLKTPKTPKSAKKTPKVLKLKSEEAEEISEMVNLTPKAAKALLKSAKKTPKVVKLISQEAEPSEVNVTTPKMTPGAKNATPKAKNKTPKATPAPDTFELESMTPKVEKKTPKAKKMTPKIANVTSNMEESAAVDTQTTPKMGKKTPKNKKKTPGKEKLLVENTQDTPVSKKKTPKKMSVVSENMIELDVESVPKKTTAASPRGKKLSPIATKLTPKVKKMTPKATKKIATPGKAAAHLEATLEETTAIPDATPQKKKVKAIQTPTQTPKTTPGKRKMSEDATPVTKATPGKKEKLKKATPGKNMTPKALSGKKTPKVSPGKRKNAIDLTPHTKKQKVVVTS